MEREALKLALEYIETNAHERKHVRHAIQAALAQPTQEPLTVYQRIAISEQCVNLEFDDDFLNDICKVIILVEAAHNIGATK